ncbi:ISL3 family transposase [Teredinibacter purpureus]|uniref:ISL3 family transposase n=1 Tax=Teredinibacter purpureus TaxID=2731756 RepID=UPI0005F7AE25|nr:ISL3 family transposase [Teredinibacter purpureus]
MDELSLYEKILSISSPWFVESVQLDERDNTVHVHVEYDCDKHLTCPLCESRCSRHDTRTRTWRHLDSCQFRTLVHANIPRSKCRTHGVLQADIPWADKRSSFTLMFEAYVISWLQEASINAVSKKLALSWNAADGIMKRAVERGLKRRSHLHIQNLAVDEVCSKKGHEYVTIVSNDHGHAIDVQEDRKKSSLNAFFTGLSDKQIQSVETISMDMSPSYIYATKEYIPHWERAICFDRFHVAMDLNKALNSVRKSEANMVAQQHKLELHRSKFAWLRSRENLKDIHSVQISTLSVVAKKTARAWAIKEYAMELWNYDDRIWAEEAWKQWYSWAIRSRLNPIKSVAKSIKKNLWGIINAIVNKKNNAGAESINSRIKMLKVKAKGFRHKARFKAAILFHLGGLDLMPEI